MKGVIAPAVVYSSSRSLKGGVTTWDEPGTRGLRDDRMSRGAGNIRNPSGTYLDLKLLNALMALETT